MDTQPLSYILDKVFFIIYRIESHRRPNWDYSANALYFLTMVTQHRVCNLGEIAVDTDGKAYMQLSDFGKIVETEWYKSFEIRKELFLHEFVIMPNHLHAIVEIDNRAVNDSTDHKTTTNDGRDNHEIFFLRHYAYTVELVCRLYPPDGTPTCFLLLENNPPFGQYRQGFSVADVSSTALLCPTV